MTTPTFDTEAPLCFDTNSVWGVVEAPRQLRRIRQRFPERRLLVPAWVVAERVRQLAVSYGSEFKPELISAFLDDESTALEIVPFSAATSLHAWRLATSKLSQSWDWKDGTETTKRPCAERCRSGDYLVYACAIEHHALLVTEDKVLAKQAKSDGRLPGIVSMSQLLET